MFVKFKSFVILTSYPPPGLWPTTYVALAPGGALFPCNN